MSAGDSTGTLVNQAPDAQHSSTSLQQVRIDPFSDALAWGSVAVSVLLIVILVVGLRINQNRLSKWVPGLSGVCMMVGFLVGLLFPLVPTRYRHGWTTADLQFHPDLFFYLLLPPIIFEAGFSLDRSLFRQNLKEVLLFAVVGTCISAFVISKGLYLYLRTVVRHPHIVGDMFGALISATDPVATIALLNRFQHKFPPRLRSVIFGEAILNDAVAIVLFDSVTARYERILRATGGSSTTTQEPVGGNVVKRLLGRSSSSDPAGATSTVGVRSEGELEQTTGNINGHNFWRGLAAAENNGPQVQLPVGEEESYYYGSLLVEFVFVSLCSLAIGVAASYTLKLFFEKHEVSKHPPYELGLMLLGCYLAYAVAQILDLSGIVALFISGVVFGEGLSEETQRAAEIGLSIVALVSECLVFFYLGLVTVMYTLDFLPHISLLFWCFFLIFFARAVQVTILSAVLNCCAQASSCRRAALRVLALARPSVLTLADERELLQLPSPAAAAEAPEFAHKNFVHPYGFSSARTFSASSTGGAATASTTSSTSMEGELLPRGSSSASSSTGDGTSTSTGAATTASSGDRSAGGSSESSSFSTSSRSAGATANSTSSSASSSIVRNHSGGLGVDLRSSLTGGARGDSDLEGGGARGRDLISQDFAVPDPSFANGSSSRRSSAISWKGQVLLVVAGLRGAISFALSLRIPETAARAQLVPCTIFLVVATTLGVGSVMEHVAGLLGFLGEDRHAADTGRPDSYREMPADPSALSAAVLVRGPHQTALQGGRARPSDYLNFYNRAALQTQGALHENARALHYEIPLSRNPNVGSGTSAE
ncbi:unnamed protein product [Amoebophrya sp. A120]|nr:unnamed protein product [Amoebophrya sp. A120]|eukprot:GSA120T00002757001.1